MAKGKFFVIEGLNGAGISTQAGLLASYLTQIGRKVIVTKEPTNNIIGGVIHSLLRKTWKTTPECLQLLFAADRAYHLEQEIEPALAHGIDVISERYFLSSLAFGSIESERSWLKEINKLFRVPDATFLIKTPPMICLERLGKKSSILELFEQKDHLEKADKNYDGLVKEYSGIHFINGNQNVQKVNEEIKRIASLELKR